jgi:hypothetical protein
MFVQYIYRHVIRVKGVTLVVHKSIMRTVVKKIVYNDRIIAIKL